MTDNIRQLPVINRLAKAEDWPAVSYEGRPKSHCFHRNVWIMIEEHSLRCRDCNMNIDPIQWIQTNVATRWEGMKKEESRLQDLIYDMSQDIKRLKSQWKRHADKLAADFKVCPVCGGEITSRNNSHGIIYFSPCNHWRQWRGNKGQST